MAEKNLDAEKALVEDINDKFKDAMVAKSKFTENWMEYINAWNNSLYEDQALPSYRSNHVSNFIFSTIESMRPIIFDGNPKFEAIPVTREANTYSQHINSMFDFEWDRTNMKGKLISNYLYSLIIGTSIIMLTWDADDDGNTFGGNVSPIMVNPLNIYPDPLATSVEDAEYIIYATYWSQKKLAQLYPEKAEELGKGGADIQYPELVNDRNEGSQINNQILVLEFWTRDWAEMESEDEEGEISKSLKYPKGRVITCAPDLGVLLEDKDNPYESGRFPFFLFKNIDVPFQFWGEGEVKWLLSPQKSINELTNQIIDNAKHTANAQWIVDSNAGIPEGAITNRPGLIIRKKPGTEIRRESPPSMPQYVNIAIETFKRDIEVISGVHDVTRGQAPGRIESGAAITALQDSAQTRIRLKVTLLEQALSQLGQEWLNHVKQFWSEDRLIPIEKPKSKVTGIPGQQFSELQQIQNPQPQMGMGMEQQLPDMNANMQPGMIEGEGSFDFIEISKEDGKALSYDYKVKVIGTVGMNINRSSLLNMLLDLIKIPAEDGLPLVTREAILDFVPEVNKDLIISYLDDYKQELEMKRQQEMMQNQLAQQLQMQGQQLNDLGGAVGGLSQRAQAEDDAKQRDELTSQGYQMGVNEALAMQNQAAKSGNIPPELMEQLATLSPEELAEVMANEPELAEIIAQM